MSRKYVSVEMSYNFEKAFVAVVWWRIIPSTKDVIFLWTDWRNALNLKVLPNTIRKSGDCYVFAERLADPQKTASSGDVTQVFCWTYKCSGTSKWIDAISSEAHKLFNKLTFFHNKKIGNYKF